MAPQTRFRPRGLFPALAVARRRLSNRATATHLPGGSASVLLFKKKFMSAIRSGEKTQTIRLWNVCRMKAGQRSYIPGAGYIRVESVEPVDLEALVDQDAWPDGFATAAALRGEIESLYAGQLAEGYRAYRVRFHLLPPDEQAAAVAARKAAKGAAASKQATTAPDRPVGQRSRKARRDDALKD